MVAGLRVSTQNPVRHLSSGRFMCDEGWSHARRVLDHDVLLLGLHGCLHIAQGDEYYSLIPGSYVFLHANTEHFGYDTDTDIGYYWVHFTSNTPEAGPSIELPDFMRNIPTENAMLLFRQLLHFANRAELNPELDQALLDYTLNTLICELCYQAGLHSIAIGSHEDNFQEILEWIRINVSRNITLNEVADTFHYQPKYFSHLFIKKMGNSFKRYLIERRITLACSLLSNTSNRISDIATQSGFADEKHFMRTFKQITGMTPTTYRHSVNRTHLNNR